MILGKFENDSAFGGARVIVSCIATTAMALALSACAVSAPLQVSTHEVSPNAKLQKTIELALSPEDTGQRLMFAKALESAFTANSISVQLPGTKASGGLIADYALSSAEATAGVVEAGKEVARSGQPDWTAEPRKRGLFSFLDRCKETRLRGTLVLFDRTTGSIAYRGSADAGKCDIDQQTIDNLANSLVADAITQLSVM